MLQLWQVNFGTVPEETSETSLDAMLISTAAVWSDVAAFGSHRVSRMTPVPCVSWVWCKVFAGTFLDVITRDFSLLPTMIN